MSKKQRQPDPQHPTQKTGKTQEIPNGRNAFEAQKRNIQAEIALLRENVSCGVRTHAELPPVDLKSTPLATRAN